MAGLGLTLASDAEICSAIGLPSAMTYPVVESESPGEPIPDMAQLCYRLNRDPLALMAPAARLDSGGDRNLGVTLVVRAGHADHQALSFKGGEPCMNNGVRQQGRTQPDLASQAGQIDTERHHFISDQGKVNARTDGIEADAPHGHESPQLPGLTPEDTEESQLYEEGFDPLEVRPSMYFEGFEKLFLCDS
jgi:hypothetical protein